MTYVAPQYLPGQYGPNAIGQLGEVTGPMQYPPAVLQQIAAQRGLPVGRASLQLGMGGDQLALGAGPGYTTVPGGTTVAGRTVAGTPELLAGRGTANVATASRSAQTGASALADDIAALRASGGGAADLATEAAPGLVARAGGWGGIAKTTAGRLGGAAAIYIGSQMLGGLAESAGAPKQAVGGIRGAGELGAAGFAAAGPVGGLVGAAGGGIAGLVTGSDPMTEFHNLGAANAYDDTADAFVAADKAIGKHDTARNEAKSLAMKIHNKDQVIINGQLVPTKTLEQKNATLAALVGIMTQYAAENGPKAKSSKLFGTAGTSASDDATKVQSRVERKMLASMQQYGQSAVDQGDAMAATINSLAPNLPANMQPLLAYDAAQRAAMGRQTQSAFTAATAAGPVVAKMEAQLAELRQLRQNLSAQGGSSISSLLNAQQQGQQATPASLLGG